MAEIIDTSSIIRRRRLRLMSGKKEKKSTRTFTDCTVDYANDLNKLYMRGLIARILRMKGAKGWVR